MYLVKKEYMCELKDKDFFGILKHLQTLVEQDKAFIVTGRGKTIMPYLIVEEALKNGYDVVHVDIG